MPPRIARGVGVLDRGEGVTGVWDEGTSSHGAGAHAAQQTPTDTSKLFYKEPRPRQLNTHTRRRNIGIWATRTLVPN